MQQATLQRLLSQAKGHIAAGEPAEAVKLLYTLVRQYPDCYEGWLLFSRGLFEAGYVSEAVQVAHHAERVDPLQQQFHGIQLCMQKGQRKDAQQLARKMLEDYPSHPRACFTLASIALAEQQPEQSIDILASAVTQLPANASLRKLLSDSYVSAGRYILAINACQVLTMLDPGFEAHWALLCLLLKYGQYTELLQQCEQALSYTSDNQARQSQVEQIRGQALRILGRRQESIASLRASLKSNPQNSEAWWALADFKNYTFTHGEKQQLASLIKSDLPDFVRCQALFTAAKISEQGNDFAHTLSLYNQANTCKAPPQYHPEAMTREFSALRQAYTPTALSVQAEYSANQLTPVFIVGLPRSGSTLLEQMLASHSQIEGTLEQPTLPAIERRMQRYVRQHYNASLNDSLEQLSATELTSFGSAYIEEGQLFRQQHCPFYLDKQPFNFRYTGLIHKLLPHAVIIDMRRNPLDCGWSLYKQYFQSGVDFSYRLAHIGAAYNEYVDLMAHWQSVLPGRVLNVQYEELVASPEQELRRIFRHIGLEYESACLNFHSADRAVHTASSEQVRLPVNRNGIGTWQKFDQGLNALKSSLRPDILDQCSHYFD
ncbi:tetratricopeptide repeat-containing sulfotransferase family protein [Alteromonas alba]|nr:sulfotransferase [Alteromonas alba]